MKEQKTELRSILLLRAVAALSVMIFHFYGNMPDITGPSLQAVLLKGYLGLKLFFVISGFIIPFSMHAHDYHIRKFPAFMLKRTVRIEPPYIMSLVLIILIQYVSGHLQGWGYVFEWKRIFLHLGYLNQYFGYEAYNDGYWTLALEFQFYIFIAVIFPFLNWKRWYIFLPVLVLFVAPQFLFYFPYNWFIMQYAPFFVAGMLVYMYMKERLNGIIFLLLLMMDGVVLWYSGDFDGIGVVLFSVPVILFLKRGWKVTDFIGRISYSLYLTHNVIGGYFILFAGHVMQSLMLRTIIATALSLLFAAGFYYAVERPVLRFSKRIRY